MKLHRIFKIILSNNSCTNRKIGEALTIYKFFLDYMAPDNSMKTVLQMKDRNITYGKIADYLGITEKEVVSIEKSCYELLANIFISLEMDDYIQNNQLFDDCDNEYIFKRVYRHVLKLNEGVRKNEQKKKREIDKQSKRLFGNLL